MRKKSETILIISTMYPSRKHPAFGVFIENQVKDLRELGYHVDVAAVKHPSTHKLMLFKKYIVWFIKLLWIMMFKGRQYDVVHAHYVFPSGLPAMLVKKMFKSKLIVTAHGGDLNKMALKNTCLFNATKKILQSADDVIAVGADLKQKMMHDYSVNKDKIHLLNMGVDRTLFTPQNQAEARDVLKLDLERKIIVFVGNLIPAKGIAELIGAFADIKQTYPDVELHLIGAQYKGGYAEGLINAQEGVVADHIHIHPAATQNAIADWLNAADLLALPSHMEGFGLVALEAMACHTPVVGTRVGGLQHLLGEGAGVLIESRNRQALSRGIQTVFGNEHFRSQLIVKGEEKAQVFDRKQIIKQLEKIYLE